MSPPHSKVNWMVVARAPVPIGNGYIPIRTQAGLLRIRLLMGRSSLGESRPSESKDLGAHVASEKTLLPMSMVKTVLTLNASQNDPHLCPNNTTQCFNSNFRRSGDEQAMLSGSSKEQIKAETAICGQRYDNSLFMAFHRSQVYPNSYVVALTTCGQHKSSEIGTLFDRHL
jgi:hypothetical protein